jgi:hypothetical protein
LVAPQVKIAQLAPAQGRQPAAYGRSNHPGAHPIHVVKPHPHVQAIDLVKVTAKPLAIIHGPSPRLSTLSKARKLAASSTPNAREAAM